MIIYKVYHLFSKIYVGAGRCRLVSVATSRCRSGLVSGLVANGAGADRNHGEIERDSEAQKILVYNVCL